MKTFHLHIRGRVQGVGFRPFVYQIATQRNLKGCVRNDTDGVHILFNIETEKEAKDVRQEIVQNAPSIAIVQSHTLTVESSIAFDRFSIAESENNEDVRLLITPDLAICDTCARELSTPGDRRYRYPFITCTLCGPRYSIMERLPYDRPLTTMRNFEMCPTCAEEYENVRERRHYSQTNSCPDCRVALFMHDANGKLVSGETREILEMTRAVLAEGKIIAVKGIGGYLLLVDATNKAAVKLLRHRKHRPSKPFALMYPSLQAVRQDVQVSSAAAALLTSPESPIVLLPLNADPATGIVVDQVAPRLNNLGVMLPYAGLFRLICEDIPHPLVATSGNISDAPIIYQDAEALKGFAGLADYIMTNDREIVIPQDDSVIRFTQASSRPIVIRRSRGLAPAVPEHPFQDWDQTVLATGGQLKSSFGFFHNSEVYLSQYLGDLGYLGAQESYRHTVNHFARMFNCSANMVIADGHPDYFARRYAEEFASANEVTLITVQHHKAHFAAVLGEADLLFADDPIMGVIWDGTGYGDDGHIWGGEFFVFENRQFERVGHLAYYQHLAGDKMAKEPRLSAFALLSSDRKVQAMLKPRFSSVEWNIYQKVLDRKNPLLTSSMGRVFDAVATVLDLCDVMTYEGEAAMYLEQEAQRFYDENQDYGASYPVRISRGSIDIQSIIVRICHDALSGVPSEEIAYRFHLTLAEMVAVMADITGAKDIAFSGGVFQNALLVDCCVRRLEGKYRLYFHKNLSPNDENIAFGQLVTAYLTNQGALTESNKLTAHVPGHTW